MHQLLSHHLPSLALDILFACFILHVTDISAQKNSVVQVHADKSSGYGVACGGPQYLLYLLFRHK